SRCYFYVLIMLCELESFSTCIEVDLHALSDFLQVWRDVGGNMRSNHYSTDSPSHAATVSTLPSSAAVSIFHAGYTQESSLLSDRLVSEQKAI
ncbi:hypothetical protein C8F01DRAFT_1143956, partial [Mycena amicta]